MGLLVVARLAERHQIQVWLSGQPMGGTVATVVLPEHLLVPTGRMSLPPVNGTAPVSGPPAQAWPALPERREPVDHLNVTGRQYLAAAGAGGEDSVMQGHLPIAGRGIGAPS